MSLGTSKAYGRSLVALILSAAGARVFYYTYGQLRFDDTPLYYYLQFVDPLLLQTDLLRSVTHLHSQPPLFNLLIGLVLKAFPIHYTLAFNVIYAALGLGLILCMFNLI